MLAALLLPVAASAQAPQTPASSSAHQAPHPPPHTAVKKHESTAKSGHKLAPVSEAAKKKKPAQKKAEAPKQEAAGAQAGQARSATTRSLERQRDWTRPAALRRAACR